MSLPLSYNLRNLLVRKLSSGLTFTVVATVVLSLSVLLAFAEGMRSSIVSSGRPDNIIVVNKGATAESTSIIRPNEYTPIKAAPHIAMDAGGNQMISGELYVQASIPRRGEAGQLANVAVRGVDPVAFEIHPNVKVAEGRMFADGQTEAIVGIKAAGRYQNLTIGSEVLLGRNANMAYKVVGIFDSGGTSYDSEVWVSRTTLASFYDRPIFSSVVMRLSTTADPEATLAYLNGPSVGLTAKLETDYYKDLSEKSLGILALTKILIVLMSLGAMFAVANTMYSSVDRRRREIAMLRTIGFSRSTVVISVLVESAILCAAACVAGFLISMPFSGVKQDFMSNTTWTVLAYELKLTPEIFVYGLLTSIAVGVLGALAPAIRASRIPIIDALRKA